MARPARGADRPSRVTYLTGLLWPVNRPPPDDKFLFPITCLASANLAKGQLPSSSPRLAVRAAVSHATKVILPLAITRARAEKRNFSGRFPSARKYKSRRDLSTVGSPQLA